jgi:ADP-heptose:LPS heptosyltransferase
MHVAAAAGARVLALFGAADPARTGPWPRSGGRHRVIFESPPCAPCCRRDCHETRHACMEDLSVERVLAAAVDMLAAGGPGGNAGGASA